MAIYRNGNIYDVYYGSRRVKEIYAGSRQVYDYMYSDEQPFTIIAKEANTVVALNQRGTVTGTDLYYSLNDGAWIPYVFGTGILLGNIGEYVRFWNKTDSFSKSNSTLTFSFKVGNSDCDVSFTGNIMSLLNLSDTCTAFCYADMFHSCTSLTTAPELPATQLATYCYMDMFHSCTSLTTAPELPATRMAQCCYDGMFHSCTSLTTAPELPATQLAYYCYMDMFHSCTSLTTAPELPATQLAYYCYADMFHSCTSLTTAPELPATQLATYCYMDMFHSCTSLTNIKTKHTVWNEGTRKWVYDISTSGTFYKPSALPEEYGEDRIPEGWTVVNID